MKKKKETIITVTEVFDGQNTDRAVFAEWIIHRQQEGKRAKPVDGGGKIGYNEGTPKPAVCTADGGI